MWSDNYSGFSSGFAIIYRDPDGLIDETFFGAPESNVAIPEDANIDIIRFMFSQAHPACSIISIEPCSYDEWIIM